MTEVKYSKKDVVRLINDQLRDVLYEKKRQLQRFPGTFRRLRIR